MESRNHGTMPSANPVSRLSYSAMQFDAESPGDFSSNTVPLPALLPSRVILVLAWSFGVEQTINLFALRPSFFSFFKNYQYNFSDRLLRLFHPASSHLRTVPIRKPKLWSSKARSLWLLEPHEVLAPLSLKSSPDEVQMSVLLVSLNANHSSNFCESPAFHYLVALPTQHR